MHPPYSIDKTQKYLHFGDERHFKSDLSYATPADGLKFKSLVSCPSSIFVKSNAALDFTAFDTSSSLWLNE